MEEEFLAVVLGADDDFGDDRVEFPEGGQSALMVVDMGMRGMDKASKVLMDRRVMRERGYLVGAICSGATGIELILDRTGRNKPAKGLLYVRAGCSSMVVKMMGCEKFRSTERESWNM